MSSNKTILVTGGTGFLGSNLCQRLIKEGHRIYCLDNFSSSDEKIIKNHNFVLIRGDVRDKSWHKILKDVKLDQIYHMACMASPPFYQSDPQGTLETCFIGTQNMINLAIEKKARLLFTSTSEVYGDPLEHPQRETYFGNVNPVGERSCYDEGKRVAETLMYVYQKNQAFDGCTVRIFNTYGPEMSTGDGRIVSNFIVASLKGESITVYGDGSQTRSLCYIDDLIEGLIKMMESAEKGPINLGNPDERSVFDIAHFIKNKINSPSEIILKELPSDDPTKRCPDITLAREKLGWEPKTSLEEGLDRTISYFKEKLGV